MDGLTRQAVETKSPVSRISSWWTSFSEVPARIIFLRQCMYFGLPMGLLTIGAWLVWREPVVDHHAHMARANAANRAGLVTETREEIHSAIAAMDRELPIARKLAELKPTGANHAALAFLLYWRGRYHESILPEIEGRASSGDNARALIAHLEAAITELERAIELGGPLGHPGRDSLTVDEARAATLEWREVVTRQRELLGAVPSTHPVAGASRPSSG